MARTSKVDVTWLCRNCGVEIAQRLHARGDTTWFHNASFANVEPECDNTAGTVAEPTKWTMVRWTGL